jgi:hypothetical protein
MKPSRVPDEVIGRIEQIVRDASVATLRSSALPRTIRKKGKKRMKTKIVLAGLTILTPAGDGHYTVTTQVRGGMTPWGEVKAASLKRADEYCNSRGEQMHQVDMQTHGVRGWTPQEAELTFSCLQVE